MMTDEKTIPRRSIDDADRDRKYGSRVGSCAGQTIVIKYGGNAMIDEVAKKNVIGDIAFLQRHGVKPVVVHGGGPAISSAMNAAGIEPQFIHGQRKTDRQTLTIVKQVLKGTVNREIVDLLKAAGVMANGLSGESGMGGDFITARKYLREVETDSGSIKVDLGYVGEVTAVNAEVLNLLFSAGSIPVVAPIGVDSNGENYNINADVLAGALAKSISADQLVFLTDVDGIRSEADRPDSRVDQLSAEQARGMIGDSVNGGMIPKVESCLKAFKGGMNRAHIVDGTKPCVVLQSTLSEDAIGTTIRA